MEATSAQEEEEAGASRGDGGDERAGEQGREEWNSNGKMQDEHPFLLVLCTSSIYDQISTCISVLQVKYTSKTSQLSLWVVHGWLLLWRVMSLCSETIVESFLC